MRRRAILMTTTAVAVAVLILGIPGAIFACVLIWVQTVSDLSLRAYSVASMVDRFSTQETRVGTRLLRTLAANSRNPTRIEVRYGDGTIVSSGPPLDGATVSRIAASTQTNAAVSVSTPTTAIGLDIALTVVAALLLIAVAFLVGLAVAKSQSRKLSAPLIYLAASAEQLGAGQVRPQMKPTGIEEIDLVTQELERTADRMAGRIAAERQFAADAAHQLRTPLTALSMRIEEIQLMATDEDLAQEASLALEQIDRLSQVVTELMATSQAQSGGTTEAVQISDVFAQQDAEWNKMFARAKRKIVFVDDAGGAVLATPGSLSQILATLIENSLKYGAGFTEVSAKRIGKTIQFKIQDEGAGIDPENAETIFDKGFSTGESTGIGLAVAKELANADGGRLELTNAAHAGFTLTLSAMPLALDPDKVLPPGAVLTVGSRRHRR
ncbi:MAG: HAMP domain-containing sensor histidine kinase [Trueperella sp.]|nr:HAMP domain-containing sensor histidine kinase [Trueperella sp.]